MNSDCLHSYKYSAKQMQLKLRKRKENILHFKFEATGSKRVDVFVAIIERRISEVNILFISFIFDVAMKVIL